MEDKQKSTIKSTEEKQKKDGGALQLNDMNEV